DIRDRQVVHEALDGCGAVIHLAGLSAWSQIDSPLMFPVVVEGTQHVLDAARAHGVGRVGYVSSVAALGPGRLPTPRDEAAHFDERDVAGMRTRWPNGRPKNCACRRHERGSKSSS